MRTGRYRTGNFYYMYVFFFVSRYHHGTQEGKEGGEEGGGGREREEQESGTCSDGGQGEGGSELVRSVLRNRIRQGLG